ncbi:hypothetical protein [Rhizobium leguminosarum]|uniref:hypothetical protein n=1 Tax=Rhizobium leguminosarum TaxID=384 RepID=UPI001C90D618|nr:hypothetical protein [Rhizobium leguminosarum]MBY2986429.1 hypothetical protein [Rhizobium leguminosarum]
MTDNHSNSCIHQDLVNAISAVCQGHKSADVLMSVSMFIGAFEAQAPRPDLDNLMRLIHNSARHTFDMIMEARANG